MFHKPYFCTFRRNISVNFYIVVKRCLIFYKSRQDNKGCRAYSWWKAAQFGALMSIDRVSVLFRIIFSPQTFWCFCRPIQITSSFNILIKRFPILRNAAMVKTLTHTIESHRKENPHRMDLTHQKTAPNRLRSQKITTSELQIKWVALSNLKIGE